MDARPISLRSELLFDARDAAAREELARRLTEEAIAQARRAVVGALAVPGAIALGAAAWVTFAVAFLERGIEVLELSRERVRDGERPAPRTEDPAEKTKQARS